MWMSSNKRGSQEAGNDENDIRVLGKRRFGQLDQQSNNCSGADPVLANDLAQYLESVTRKMIEVFPRLMEEALSRTLPRCICPSCGTCGLSLDRQIGAPGRRDGGRGRALELRFMDNLPSKFFTHSTKITAEDGSPLRIALCDATSQDLRVREDVSLVKVQLCVLKGDFGSDGSDDWSAEEFSANTISPRDGKPPLLGGDTILTLKNGVGSLPQSIVFTDNSGWTRSKSFRLGFKVINSSSNEAEIKEARSQPLRVRDHRGLAYKKHDHPSLNDEVWRLQKIAKNGSICTRLSLHGIETVKDLLRLYTTNQALLREKIGNIPNKSWYAIIEHAKACEIHDDERYLYQYLTTARQSISLVFNCIYEVVEVSFNGQNPRSVESLNLAEKSLVERAKLEAYNNLTDLKLIEAAPHNVGMTAAVVSSGAPYQGLPTDYLPGEIQEQLQMWQNLSQPSTSKSLIDKAAHNDQVISSQLPYQLTDMALDWSFNGNVGSICGSQNGEFGSFITPLTSAEMPSFFDFPHDYGAESINHSFVPKPAVYIPIKGSRNRVWKKIRNAFKCAVLHAAKRKAKIYQFQY